MNAMGYIREENIVGFCFILIGMAFLAVALNVVWPLHGVETFSGVVWMSAFFGLMFGFSISGPSRRELTSAQRWLARLLSFTLHFIAMLIGGGIGILVFKS